MDIINNLFDWLFTRGWIIVVIVAGIVLAILASFPYIIGLILIVVLAVVALIKRDTLKTWADWLRNLGK